MNDFIKLIGSIAFAFAVGAHVNAKAEELDPNFTPKADEPFLYQCQGRALDPTAQACANKLMQLCEGGVEILQARHTPEDVTPAIVQVIAKCKVMKT